MRTTRIVTAKIEPDIYKLILDGSKTHEVRDEPFDADIIRYVSSEDGSLLGVHRLWNEERVPRLKHTEHALCELAGITYDKFIDLFHAGPERARNLYVADIGRRHDTVDELLKGKQ